MAKINGMRVEREIHRLRRSLMHLHRSLGHLTRTLSAGTLVDGASKGNGRSRPRLSAKARVSMVLQGRYMGFVRQLRPRQKAQVRKIRAAKGVRAAISRAKWMAR